MGSDPTKTEAALLRMSPIRLGDVARAPSGKPFTIHVVMPAPSDKKAPDLLFSVVFRGDKSKAARAEITEEAVTAQGHVFSISTIVPPYEEIFTESGWFVARRAKVDVTLLLDEDEYTHTFDFAVPLRKAGTLWGVMVLLALLVTVRLMNPTPFHADSRFQSDTRAEEWGKRPGWVRSVLYPLDFAVTPVGNYSISIVQILFWTAIVIFASVYVFYVRKEFLSINDQILGLLGIAAGTALTSKVNAVIRSREIPQHYLKDLNRTRLPHPRDLISTGGVPNVFKFQIFAFTLINGIIVLRQLYAEFNFPELPAEQLTLMGMSGAIYVGNEMISTNVWETLQKKVEKAEAISNKTSDEYKQAKAEIQGILQEIYQ